MFRLIRRLYRSFFNPYALAGQTWMVDGIGLVIVRDTKIEKGHSIKVEGPSGIELTWRKDEFYQQSILWSPTTLEEASNVIDFRAHVSSGNDNGD